MAEGLRPARSRKRSASTRSTPSARAARPAHLGPALGRGAASGVVGIRGRQVGDGVAHGDRDGFEPSDRVGPTPSSCAATTRPPSRTGSPPHRGRQDRHAAGRTQVPARLQGRLRRVASDQSRRTPSAARADVHAAVQSGPVRTRLGSSTSEPRRTFTAVRRTARPPTSTSASRWCWPASFLGWHLDTLPLPERPLRPDRSEYCPARAVARAAPQNCRFLRRECRLGSVREGRLTATSNGSRPAAWCSTRSSRSRR